MLQENLPALYLPAVDAMRTIYCYVTLDGDEADRWISVIAAGYRSNPYSYPCHFLYPITPFLATSSQPAPV